MLQASNPESPYYYDAAAAEQDGQQTRTQSVVRNELGKYEGEVDKDGMRIGVGTCTWSDGSYYRGDWAQNVRHGNGVYVTGEGTKFEGQWINDVKHGHGQLIYKDGEEITGTWLNDRLNGLA